MEGESQNAQDSAGGAAQADYSKEWAEYYAKMGYTAYGQPAQGAAATTGAYAQQGAAAGYQQAAGANPWANYQQYPASGTQAAGTQQAYGAYPGYSGGADFQQGYGGQQQRGGARDNPHQQNQPSTTVWVGNLAPTVFEQDLYQAFGAFGAVREVKLLRDKSCAFVRFNTIEDATAAFRGMSNQPIHGMMIRVGWGKADERQDRQFQQRDDPRLPDMPPARNLWIGNIDMAVGEEELRAKFSPFGPIERINMLPMKNCAFVNFVHLESALKAKEQLHGALMGSRNIRINFGKQTDKDREAYAQIQAGNSIDPTAVALTQPPGPTDAELKGVIDKLAAHVVKAGPQFEETVRNRNSGDPKFSFLSEGGEFYDYYKWKLFDERQKKNQAEGITSTPALPAAAAALAQSFAQPRPAQPAAPSYSQPQAPAQQSQPWQPRQPATPSYQSPSPSSGYQPPSRGGLSSVKPLAPPPTGSPLSDKDKSALSTILDTLVPTKESIKTGKDFIMSHPDSASATAAFICQRLEATPDFSAKLNMIYLTNDVLHHSMKMRNPGAVGDQFCDAFKPYVPVMLWSAHQNPNPENQAKVTKMIDIWKQKGIYNLPTMNQMEQIVLGSSAGGPPSSGGPPSGHGAMGAPHRGRGGLGYTPGPEDRGSSSQSQYGGGRSDGGSYNSVPPPSNIGASSSGRRTFSEAPPPAAAALMGGIDDLLASARGRAEEYDLALLLSILFCSRSKDPILHHHLNLGLKPSADLFFQFLYPDPGGHGTKRGRSPSPESRHERPRFR